MCQRQPRPTSQIPTCAQPKYLVRTLNADFDELRFGKLLGGRWLMEKEMPDVQWLRLRVRLRAKLSDY